MDTGTKFIELAELLSNVSLERSKNRKVELISGFLRRLSGDELEYSVMLMSGRPTRVGEPDIQVGYSTIAEVLLEITGKKKSELLEKFVKYGDIGEVCLNLMKESKERTLFESELTIVEVARTFETLSRLRGKGSAELRKKYVKSLLINSRPVEAKYLVKIMTGELRTGAVNGIIEDSIAKAFLVEKEKVSQAHLLLGDIARVALIASTGGIDHVHLEYFVPFSFMLAETAKTPREAAEHFGKRFYAEFKYDGIRAQIHKKGSNVKIFSRRMEDITSFFPEIVEDASSCSRDFMIDGEIVAHKEGRPLEFFMLQRRLRRQKQEGMLDQIPVVFFCFDILMLDKREVYKEKLSSRIELLREVVSGRRIVEAERRIVATESEVGEMFELSKKKGYEGLVLKDPDSSYTVGKRGADWVKLKSELDTLDCVVVAAEYGHGKRAGVLSDYTFAVWDNERLVTIGKAYSGLTDREIREMTERLNEITVQDLGYLKKVRPEIVLEVAFDSIQRSERHESGFALRFPRIKRIRYDKGPEEADSLEKVIRIYNSQGRE